MKIIDGKDVVMGRLASYAAKESLKGEEIVVVNCNEVIITGSKKNIEEKFKGSRDRVGSSQKGPKIIRNSERIVKRAIRGMLPNHRFGRGRDAFKKIKCYNKVPKEFEEAKKISMNKSQTSKFIYVNHLSR
ncbi:50S ribosomal protein L13 [Candidatus Pacearchaeota archaeon]|nr:50S ribosomal protein L13 [Candidatus Pacearchaeota archaeon]